MQLRLMALAGLLWASAGMAESRPVVSVNFDEWQWVPLSPAMVAALKAAKAKGDGFGVAVRGPLWEHAKGFHGSTGMKAEGVKGKCAFLDAGKGTMVVGLDSPFDHLLEPGKSYSYAGWLKGKGVFRFKAWEGGVNPATGKEKWLGFPELVAVKAAPEWRRFEGVFTLPDLSADGFRAAAKVSCAIVVEPGDVIYVDEFSVSQTE